MAETKLVGLERAQQATNIAFSGPLGDFAVDYMNTLLFRDNVQHYLQAGRPEPGYALIHSIADAPIDGEILRFDAKSLWLEISEAFEGIRRIGVRDVAVSIRTRANVTKTLALPAVRGTVLLRFTGWRLRLRQGNAATLGELFREIAENVELVTRAGTANGVVHVAARTDGTELASGTRNSPSTSRSG